MIELHAISVIVGAFWGAVFATLYHKLPKKRKRRTK